MWINDHTLSLMGSVVPNLSYTLESLGGAQVPPQIFWLHWFGHWNLFFTCFNTLYISPPPTLFSLHEISASGVGTNLNGMHQCKLFMMFLSNHQISLRISSSFNAFLFFFFDLRDWGVIYCFLIILLKYYNKHNL